jgi:hypothetical protein
MHNSGRFKILLQTRKGRNCLFFLGPPYRPLQNNVRVHKMGKL